MRGKPTLGVVAVLQRRNIPAYAGKTYLRYRPRSIFKEHPRVCGENRLVHPRESARAGTSPRMRGKLKWVCRIRLMSRNIPAYAGKTVGRRPVVWDLKEHPRVCGENLQAASGGSKEERTSPRMRGKLAGNKVENLLSRNIPAYAGKTPVPSPLRRSCSEHPRVCGENC